MERAALNPKSEYNDFKKAGFFFFIREKCNVKVKFYLCSVICCSLAKAWLDIDLYRLSGTAVFKKK